MVTAVRSRPNHYETLGLSPSASDDEIRSAFARMMGMFGAHPVVAATGVSAAFEVLRNPDKRRAYDRSLGLVPEPSSSHWKVAGVGWSSPGLLGTAWGPPAKRDSVEIDAPAPRDPPTDAELAPPAEPRLASFISSSLRDLARPMAPEMASEPANDVTPQVEPDLRRPEAASAAVERDLPATPRREAEIWIDTEPRQGDLRRPALMGLGAVVAAGLIGAIAGATADDRGQAPPATKRGAVTVALPEAALQPDSTLTAPVPVARISQTRTQWRGRAGARSASVEDQRPAQQQLAAAARRPVENSPSADSGLSATLAVDAGDARSEPQADAPKAKPLGSASLPLP